jgi:porphobilinogen synthase
LSFPQTRHRRLRLTGALRALCRETLLSPDQFILPCFVLPGKKQKRPIASMPGQWQYSIDQLLPALETPVSLGIRTLLLFGIPERKSLSAAGAYDKNGIVQQALRAIKKASPELTVVADTCLCEYTLDGHCGLRKNGIVDNDASLKLIVKTAVSQADAGADGVAPSCMFDGMVSAIRQGLDSAGHENRFILAYSAKYASAFYGPFREAAGSGHFKGHRRDHQMEPANAREAVKEALTDVEEGADMVMIKPALAYLDIISKVKASVHVPVAAYNVSGEYALIVKGAELGLIDRASAMMETLYAIKRAGADIIITYFAEEAARWLKNQRQ